MMANLFIGVVAFELFLNLYIIEIFLLISSSLLLPEHIIVISVPAKRELVIQVQYAMSSIRVKEKRCVSARNRTEFPPQREGVNPFLLAGHANPLHHRDAIYNRYIRYIYALGEGKYKEKRCVSARNRTEFPARRKGRTPSSC